MRPPTEYSKTLLIRNPLGFHVRPVQRFAELAALFRSEIEVEIDGRKASGKSMMALVGLGGQHGSLMKITTTGEDARQALDVLGYLVEENFFVEDDLDTRQYPRRHIERLVKLASCFRSKVWVGLNDRKANARDPCGLVELGLKPTSEVSLHVSGEDSNQARKVLNTLVRYRFYVEEEMGTQSQQKAD